VHQDVYALDDVLVPLKRKAKYCSGARNSCHCVVTNTNVSDRTAVVAMLQSLLSTTAFGLGAKYFAFYEIEGVGVQWDNMAVSPVEGDQYNLQLVVLMMVFDALFYGVLTWYIENVHPGSYRLLSWRFPYVAQRQNYYCFAWQFKALVTLDLARVSGLTVNTNTCYCAVFPLIGHCVTDQSNTWFVFEIFLKFFVQWHICSALFCRILL
jgi:hypothetical protein